MGIGFMLISIIITFMNIDNIEYVFQRIFTEAFSFQTIFGTFAGSALMMEIKRGLFPNEAGVGSAPSAAATAEVIHPVNRVLLKCFLSLSSRCLSVLLLLLHHYDDWP